MVGREPSRTRVTSIVPSKEPLSGPGYRGRLAPSPTGHLHLGHARTFWIAQERARARHGTLILRNEDLDANRCKPEFVRDMMEDLRWFGFNWDEGPDCGGPHAPYAQNERRSIYVNAFSRLREGGFVYPCACSRRDVQQAARAPHPDDEEPIYPGTCRGRRDLCETPELWIPAAEPRARRQILAAAGQLQLNWRFRVPDGEPIAFLDGQAGPQVFVAGRDFGDFIVWRHDDVPSYQLAVTVDDAAMGITEVVRGADLLVSTARQILLYRALGLKVPAFHHCPLLTDEHGVRLAKRHAALCLRELREGGHTPEELRRGWANVRW